jgi:hypothetical protein
MVRTEPAPKNCLTRLPSLHANLPKRTASGLHDLDLFCVTGHVITSS